MYAIRISVCTEHMNHVNNISARYSCVFQSLVLFPKIKRQVLLSDGDIKSQKDIMENTMFWINQEFLLMYGNVILHMLLKSYFRCPFPQGLSVSVCLYVCESRNTLVSFIICGAFPTATSPTSKVLPALGVGHGLSTLNSL